MPSTKRRADNMDDSVSRKRQQLRHNTADSESVNDGNSRPEVPTRTEAPLDSSKVVVIPDNNDEHVQTLKLLHNDFDVLRGSLTCKICEKLFYEPYVLSCGHTYCYRCLSTWFSSTHKMSCPNCREKITQTPAPSYAIKDMVMVFTKRAELLPDGETVQEHEVWRKEEEEHLAADKNNKDPRIGGIFKGRFNGRRGVLRPVVDPTDNVARCPMCNWELEDDSCTQCGIHFDSEGYESASDDYDSYNEEIDDELDGEMAAEDPDSVWYAGELGPHGYPDGASDDSDSDASTHDGFGTRMRHRPVNLTHDDLHRQQHDFATRNAGHPIRNVWARTNGWPTDRYPEDEEDEEEEDDEEEDGGSMDGFVVRDDSDGANSHISVSSDGEEDEPIRAQVARNASAFTWGGQPATSHRNGRRGRNRIVVESSDEENSGNETGDGAGNSENSDNSSGESNSDGSSQTVGDAEGHWNGQDAYFAQRHIDSLSATQSSSSGEEEDEEDEPPRPAPSRRMNFQNRRRQPAFQRAGRATRLVNDPRTGQPTTLVDADGGYRQIG